ncbi:putative methyltransferase NSUN7 [Acropora muricata]|uniref:putative methyltransferase NSUN7 n=1 Tax=Acropora muricata TaxID=159855 RepID=UPI0034E4EC0A
MLRKGISNSAGKAKKSTSTLDASNGVKQRASREVSSARISTSETSVFARKKRDAFNHYIYEKAADIYRHLKGEIPSSQLPTFEDDLERRRAYSLAFGAQRYQSVLDDVLLDSYFFSSYFKFETNHKHQVLVMLLDYQQNGFYFGNERYRNKKVEIPNRENCIPHILEIQQAMVSHRIKLRAALARSRIRDCAISVEALLPKEEQDKIQYSAQQPVYARINICRTSYSEVLETLTSEGFLLEDKLSSPEDDDSGVYGRTFMKDQHFENLLVFSPTIKFDLYDHDLVLNGKLAIQDKASIAAAEVFNSVVLEFCSQKQKAVQLIPGADVKQFLGEGDDVIQTHVESGNMTAHLSSLIHPDRNLFACDVPHETREQIEGKLEKMAARNVVLLGESFLDALPTDERLKNVRLIVVNVPCSKSGVVNPVDFVLQEGIATSIKELARGKTDSSKLKGLAFQHLSFLRHAMKFPQAQAIVYVTRSTHSSENMEVVKKAMEMNQDERSVFELSPALPQLAESLRESARASNGLKNDVSLNPKEQENKYLFLEPSAAMNGGFVALLKRQKPVESAQEVLERAAKKGLMKPKTKGSRATSPREKPKPARAQADMARLNLSDKEAERKSSEKNKPSAEDVPKNTPQPKPFMF